MSLAHRPRRRPLRGVRPVRDEPPEPTRARAAHVAGLLSEGPTEREEVPMD